MSNSGLLGVLRPAWPRARKPSVGRSDSREYISVPTGPTCLLGRMKTKMNTFPAFALCQILKLCMNYVLTATLRGKYHECPVLYRNWSALPHAPLIHILVPSFLQIPSIPAHHSGEGCWAFTHLMGGVSEDSYPPPLSSSGLARWRGRGPAQGRRKVAMGCAQLSPWAAPSLSGKLTKEHPPVVSLCFLPKPK